MTRIADLLDKGKTYSFEFFPPKNDAEQATLVDDPARARAPRPLVRVGHLPGRGRVAAADRRPGHRDAADHQPGPHGPPHLRGPHPPRAGRDPGRTTQAGHGEPDGPGRRPADRPRRGPGSSPTPRSWWSWPGPSAGSPSVWPPSPAGHPLSPTWRSTATTWRPSWPWPTSPSPSSSSRPTSTPAGRRPGRAGGHQAGPAGDHAGDRLSSVPRMAHGRGRARVDGRAPGGGRRRRGRRGGAPRGGGLCHRTLPAAAGIRGAGPALLHAQPVERDPRDLLRPGPRPEADGPGARIGARPRFDRRSRPSD